MMIFPSYYLAPISYYALLAQADEVGIDVTSPYRKQSLRNRCWIASPNGPLALTVPVVKFVPYHTPMRDIRISDHGNWRHLHWNALVSSYSRTPYFEFYADEFAPFYEKKWDFLVDYNAAVQQMLCRELEISHAMGEPEEYRREASDNTILQPEDYYSSGQDNASQGQARYYQLFSDRQGFMPNLSIVDLLFNMGPESILYLSTWKQ